MAIAMPSFILPLVLQLVAVLPGLIQHAETAFSGQPGSGDQKKAFVLEAATALLLSMGTINPTLMTKKQSDAVMATIASIIDSIVLALNTAKLFETPKV